MSTSYQIWSFAKPGLLDGEKKLMLPFAISSFILFYLGAIFAFYIVEFMHRWQNVLYVEEDKLKLIEL